MDVEKRIRKNADFLERKGWSKSAILEREAADRISTLTIAGERGCFVLMEMMKAYERRIRSDCTTQEQIDKKPWECAEYLAAADYLKAVWQPDQGSDKP